MFDQYIQSANTASVLISSIPAGTLLPISVVRVNNAGTTAAAILAGY
jgi:hypothetical protein